MASCEHWLLSRNVALASPVSLLAILKGAAFSWGQAVLTDNARELFELSKQLYERLDTMGGHVTKLGTSVAAAMGRYNSFVGALESRVLPTARRIGAFDAAPLEAVDAAVGNSEPSSASSGGRTTDVTSIGTARNQRAGGSATSAPGSGVVEAVPRPLTAHELLDGTGP